MAINNNVTIEQSLIGRTVLQPSFDFSGAAQGAINQITLQNRVKKLDQSVRQELITELDKLTALIKNPPRRVVLKERALSLVLLNDDGIDATTLKTCGCFAFFVSIWLGLQNLLGNRVSSAEIMDKITEFRAALTGAHIAPLAADLDPTIDVVVAMNAAKSQLEEEESAFAVQAAALVERLEGEGGLKNTFAEASRGNWTSPNTFFYFGVQRSNLLQAVTQNGAIPDTNNNPVKREIQDSLGKIDTVLVLGRSIDTAPILARQLINAISHDLGNVTVDNLRRIESGEKQSSVEKLRNNLIVPFINAEFQAIVRKLNNYKARIGREKNLIITRLESFKTNNELDVQRNSLRQADANIRIAKNNVRIAEKALEDQNELCVLIDGIAEGIVVSLDDISNRIAEAKRSLDISRDDALKNRGDCLKHLNNMMLILTPEEELPDESADVTKVSKRSIADGLIHTDLLDDCDWLRILRAFKANPASLVKEAPLRAPAEVQQAVTEAKRAFINAYVSYLKTVFDIDKGRREPELGVARERLYALQPQLRPQQPPQQPLPLPLPLPMPLPLPLPANIIPELRPNLPLQPPQLPQPLLPPIVLPELGPSSSQGARIIHALAKGMQNLTPNGTWVWYTQLKSSVENSDLQTANQVYGNFYFIMKDAGLIGTENNLDWGKEVFNKRPNEYGNLVLVGADPAAVDRARVQAMCEVIRGQIRNRVGLTF